MMRGGGGSSSGGMCARTGWMVGGIQEDEERVLELGPAIYQIRVGRLHKEGQEHLRRR
jgi:hypothetical protein